MNNKSTQAQKGNIQIEQSDNLENYFICTKYHLQDNRLTTSEKGLLTELLALPKNWKLTTRATSKYFNLARNTFTTYLNNLIKYGYVEKLNINGQITYKINRTGNITEQFDPYKIRTYTKKQLIYFVENKETPIKYIFLIQKYLKKSLEFEKELNKFIEECENKKF